MRRISLAVLAGLALTCPSRSQHTEWDQVPSWSQDDMDFFLHGSMSTEFVPEPVMRAFLRAYPDLFPTSDFSHLGLVPDPAFGWPVGLSRRAVPHLGGLQSLGTNCAACHFSEIADPPQRLRRFGVTGLRVLGVTSHFDAEAFFGTILVATFRTADPANMKRFLAEYLSASDPAADDTARERFNAMWQQQEEKVIAAITADPGGGKSVAPGALNAIDGATLRLDLSRLADGPDLPALAGGMLKLFHNMRAALHVPDQPPEKAPPASGPGRNDAFGLLSAALFGVPQPPAPVKFGLVWNLDQRHWVHWDGNTQSPIGRNVLAALGLGAPLVGRHGQFDFAAVQRHTGLSEHIHAPRFPYEIDRVAASRGIAHFQSHCASCHSGPETDARLFSTAEIGTDASRASAFTPQQAERFNHFLASVETAGYSPPKEPGIRSTTKYWSPTLAGVWARSPYLHNGSVRTMQELLTPPAGRAKTFHRGSRVYDPQMGYTDEGPYLLDTSTPGNSNAGHDYGTRLSPDERRDLMEYLKTL